MITHDDKNSRKKLGEKLRVARENLGLTQSELAAKSGISTNYYAVIERGGGNLTVEKLQRIMKVLNIKSIDAD